VKPNNVLCCGGVWKLSDFGVSKEATTFVSTRSATISSALLTSRYCAPEAHEAEVLDPRADIYSAGMIAYQMLAGVVPFVKYDKNGVEVPGEINSDYEVNERKVDSDAEPLSTYAPKIDKSFCDIVMKMIARDRDERYQTMNNVVEDMNRI
jgi:serine/threonine-protein kinase